MCLQVYVIILIIGLYSITVLLILRNTVVKLGYVCLELVIENVGRLKKLEYLNLALNNIERIENLEGKLNFKICVYC